MAKSYLPLITSEHRDKPKYSAFVDLLTHACDEQVDTLASLSLLYDLDAAVGNQLDVVGVWVGISRKQRVPLGAAVFTWNDPAKGWNYASWKHANDPSEGVVLLDDATYRLVLRARIACNYWIGTVGAAGVIGNTVLLDDAVVMQMTDHFDMSVTVTVTGPANAALRALIERNLIYPKTAGVRINYYFPGTDPLVWRSVVDPIEPVPVQWAISGTHIGWGTGAIYSYQVQHSAAADNYLRSGGKRYAEAHINVDGTSSATNSYWLVVVDSIGTKFGQAYAGHYTRDGSILANPYPAASNFGWDLGVGGHVLRYAFDFANNMFWMAMDGGAWAGYYSGPTPSPVTGTNGQPHGLNGVGMSWWLFGDAAYPSLSLDLCTTPAQFTYSIPAGFTAWSA